MSARNSLGVPRSDDACHARSELVHLLQLAYSGELGAALAYRGHAASVSDPDERRHIRHIRSEELEHRDRVGRMLQALGGRPSRLAELRNASIGTAIAAFCHVGGWYLPMYGAGWIERRNIAEYERAARLALHSSDLWFVDDLLAMAEVEWEHERYFRLKAASHPLARVLPVWRGPGPRQDIRRRAARTLASVASPLPLAGVQPLAAAE